jgi:hypothetical protein
MQSERCTINEWHCENCGSTDVEDLDGDQGYTACCNELPADSVVCRNHHGGT